MQTILQQIKEQFQTSAQIKTEFAEKYASEILATAELMVAGIRAGGKLLICGNGGSAADAQHFAAEMIGRLARERQAIPAIALTTDTSILTSVGNDYSYDDIFKRQVEGLGAQHDVLVALSTSGNSPNVVRAVEVAREKNIKTVALLGKGGGQLAAMVDIALVVASNSSQRIQETHITTIHAWCELIEDMLYPT